MPDGVFVCVCSSLVAVHPSPDGVMMMMVMMMMLPECYHFPNAPHSARGVYIVCRWCEWLSHQHAERIGK